MLVCERDESDELRRRWAEFSVVIPEAAAKRVVRNLNRDIGRIHFLAFWAEIALVLRALPWIVYRRLEF
jgi:hypothetical protein